MYSHKFFSIPSTVAKTALSFCYKIGDEISKKNPHYALLEDLGDQLLNYKRHVYDAMLGSRSASPAFSEDDDILDKFIAFRVGEFRKFDCSF
ncbi:hypothetical protein L3Y34_012654 [Caenorhabditis briggsae]|uniref:Uncharacterized protein n=1 Tax=Caenorhabditis briggsae TaxID=6238 RepID=A0AAE8ZT17_CAEBR|nr:hypothetical protein L3Y34_012654 [Caenorhabditis briggsae]